MDGRVATGTSRAGLALTVLLTVLLTALLPACKEEARSQLYFEDLKPTIGSGKVNVVSDTSLNRPTGGEVTVLVEVEPEVDKDELERLMQSFHRQVRMRGGFEGPGGVQKIDLRFYTSAAQAKAGGADWVASVEQATPQAEPTFTNKQKAPLLKWAKQAIGNMQEFTGSLKPQILADPATMSLEISWPFIEHDGSGKYVETLSHEKATTEFSSIVISCFERIPGLAKLTFTGKHNDQVAIRVMLTREQFDALKIKHEEEMLGAFQGQFIELILSKKVTEKQVSEKVRKQRQKVYREMFSRLPESQVELIKGLR